MTDEQKLNQPWMVAAWPGMGNVALSAAYYLMSKLEMHGLAELRLDELFDVDYVDVSQGSITMGRRARNRFFVWIDPAKKHDIIVFIGEAQPPLGRYAFCRRLVEFAQSQGVQRVFTFAAMATQMHPEHESRVFYATIDEESLRELKQLELEVLEEGRISGLNGLLLGVAAENGLRGACLLGEMPHIFSQVPFPKASLAVLEAFTSLAGIELDTSELAEQAKIVEQQLGQFLARVEKSMERPESPEEGEFREEPEEPEERGLSPADEHLVEELFAQAEADRSKAYELKRELDRLGVFPRYEDRFLDLFQDRSGS